MAQSLSESSEESLTGTAGLDAALQGTLGPVGNEQGREEYIRPDTLPKVHAKMKLYVDDLRKCPEGWDLARTNTDAIMRLATGYVDEISIDHDICVPYLNEKLRIRLCVGNETFMPVVYYICLMPKEIRPKTIRIHTANYPAGLRMERLLIESGMVCEVLESDQAFEKVSECEERRPNESNRGKQNPEIVGPVGGTEDSNGAGYFDEREAGKGITDTAQ